jgi:hypothetical protein
MIPPPLPTIWGTYMKLVTKYQISAINICWEKCDEKCACMLNVYKSQLSRQTGSRNLTGQKTLPTKWGTYMKLVTKYQISAISICWEKYLGRTDRGKTVYPPPPPGSGGIIKCCEILLMNLVHWRHSRTWRHFNTFREKLKHWTFILAIYMPHTWIHIL